MPAAHGTLIGFIELENDSSRDHSFDLDDSTIWRTLSRLGATEPTWNDWDSPPGDPQTDSAKTNSPRFEEAALDNYPLQDEPTVPAENIPTGLEANLSQLLDDLNQVTIKLTERIAREAETFRSS